ncbi:MAG: AI-2E family transporter, partial [Alphaproteobacteria bacterium]|nr:AI-2E family transporter [Alphaproteobacteria bacterium]
SRIFATIIITLAFFVIIAGVLVMLFPLLQGQVIAIADRLPDLFALIERLAGYALERIESVLPPDALQRAGNAAGDYAGVAVGWMKTLASRLWSGGLALFQIISLILVTPIVSFYMLLEWDNIVAKLDQLLPRKQAPVIRQQLSLIDRTISAFVRGQSSVCLVLAAYYAIGLSLIGLETGLLIGLSAGLISFVPYVGALSGIAVGVGIAIVQFDSLTPIMGVAAIFIVGQLAESYVLTPRLVGDKVGLHDLWVIFALMAGGTLFGFTGVLLAVPTAAIIGVLLRFSVGKYLNSALYTGHGADSGHGTPAP